MADESGKLGRGFEPRGVDDWQALVARDLERGDPARLSSRTEDGIEIQPLYTGGDILELPGRQRAEVERLVRIGAEANGRVAEGIAFALAHGATGVLLELSGPGHAGGLAVETTDWNPIFTALAGTRGLHLRANVDPLAHARAWLEAEAFGRCPDCSLGLDPFAVAARTGNFAALADELGAAARLAAEALNHPARPRAFVFDTAPYSGAGATGGQSIGCAVAALVEALRALEDASVDPARGLDAIGLCVRLDPRFFEEIALLRALRLLHARVAAACGIDSPRPLHLTAMPAERMLSRRDPWVNLLRQTATGFAALVGGADAVGTVAFDSRLERPSELGRRIARNTQTILAEESHLARVHDPAAGSWFLDQFTRDLAGAGWEFFQAIEREGGLSEAMASGWLLARLEEKHLERAARIAKRKMPRTGVSEFADVAEKLPAPVAVAVARPPGAWPVHGFDDAFDALRAAADRHAVAHARPRVFLARVGAPAAYSARETWLVNLLAAAGIEAVAGDPGGDLATRFGESGSGTAILTTDDATLAERGVGLVGELAASGRVWVAGRPVDALEAAGVGRFVHVGIDVVEALSDLLSGEGVEL